ncbi:Lipoprotein OS=Streptomyces griseorubiginosus OX=67304 GN=DWG14_07161 PE=4 SV=1 [Streptomyces griseorubiginosus]
MRGNLRLSAVARVVRTSRVTRVHRTTTTATLLVTVAVSALTGCVTIQRPPVTGPPPTTAPSQAPGPEGARPDGQAEPQIVQAPAQEALSMIDPSRSAKPGGDAPRTAPGTAAAPARPEHRHPEHPRPEHPVHAAPPERRHSDVRRPRPPRVEIPDVATSIPKSVPRSQKDVCALGRKYGRWQEGSAESVICDQTYTR